MACRHRAGRVAGADNAKCRSLAQNTDTTIDLHHNFLTAMTIDTSKLRLQPVRYQPAAESGWPEILDDYAKAASRRNPRGLVTVLCTLEANTVGLRTAMIAMRVFWSASR